MTVESAVGKVYLVGAGPGDPGLLTEKGIRCLQQADLVLYDGLVNPLLLRHTSASCERTSRVADSTGPKLHQEEINQRLVTAGLEGKVVVRLKGGDPFIFGRGSEEAAALAAAGVPYEVVPGITAATAASEYAGISLTHRSMASAVAFVTGHEDPAKSSSAVEYDVLAKFPGTLVFYMGLHRIAAIADALIAHGKAASTPAAVISRGSTAFQRTVVAPLGEIAKAIANAGLKAPSLIIVGEVVSQRADINWFEQLPLSGCTIGITRPQELGGSQVSGRIEGHCETEVNRAFELGAQAVLMPTIEVRAVTDWDAVDATLARIHEFDWLIFTSVNGVDALLGRLWETGGDARALSATKIACIGSSTGERLASYHLRADLIPSVFRGEALAEALRPHVQGRKVLWARASRGRDILPTELTKAGADYSEVVVYEHCDVARFSPEIEEMFKTGDLHWVGLSSPSIARNIAHILTSQGIDLQQLSTRFVAISPVTAAAAAEVGLPITITATTHTWEGIFQAILTHQQSGDQS